jgi:hypothetical protein
MIDLQQPVEHAGTGEGRVLLDRQHRAEAVVDVGSTLRLQDALGKVQARRPEIAAKPHAGQPHGPRHTAGQYGVQERAGLRIRLAFAIDDAKRSGAVFLQFASDVAGDLLEFIDALAIALFAQLRPRRPVESPRERCRRTQRAAHPRPHDRQIEYIGEHPLG